VAEAAYISFSLDHGSLPPGSTPFDAHFFPTIQVEMNFRAILVHITLSAPQLERFLGKIVLESGRRALLIER